MVSKLKLELVKVLLQNKISKLNESISQLEKIVSFFEKVEDKDILLTSFLNEKELKAIGTIFWLSFKPIEDGISLELGRKFHQLSDEYSGQEIHLFISNIEEIITGLEFEEIYRVKEALSKVQYNIDRLNNE